MELHGGSIGAYSNEDRGATFYFDLPLVQASVFEEPDSVVCSEMKNADAKEMNPQVVQADFLFAKYTALVVEDEPELRSYLFSVLQAEFKDVYVAGDGEEAWETLNK